VAETVATNVGTNAIATGMVPGSVGEVERSSTNPCALSSQLVWALDI